MKSPSENQSLTEFLKLWFEKKTSEESTPEELEKEVFATLDSLEFLGNVADLFSNKLIQTETEMLQQLTESSFFDDNTEEKSLPDFPETDEDN